MWTCEWHTSTTGNKVLDAQSCFSRQHKINYRNTLICMQLKIALHQARKLVMHEPLDHCQVQSPQLSNLRLETGH